jgi:hypothetical protein
MTPSDLSRAGPVTRDIEQVFFGLVYDSNSTELLGFLWNKSFVRKVKRRLFS